MFVYCQICGFITNSKEQCPKCKVCENSMQPVPDEFLSTSGFMFSSQKKRKEFEEYIKQGETYNELIAQKKDDILEEKEALHNAEVNKKVEEYQKNKVKLTCPVCRSQSLTKISNLGKIAKVSAFGILGAGDIGKKYKCNSCGYHF